MSGCETVMACQRDWHTAKRGRGGNTKWKTEADKGEVEEASCKKRSPAGVKQTGDMKCGLG